MANMEENQDKRENKSENRNVNIDQNSPEILQILFTHQHF